MGEKALFYYKDVEQLAKPTSISVLQANLIHQPSLSYDPKVESLNVLEDAEHQEVTRNRKYVNGNQYTTLKYKSSNPIFRIFIFDFEKIVTRASLNNYSVPIVILFCQLKFR